MGRFDMFDVFTEETEGELQELIRLTDESERLNVERIKHLLELAHLRSITLDEVMEQLAIKPATA